MAITHVTKVYGIKQAKLSPMTADPAGGSAAYGAGFLIPGAKSLTIAGTVNTKALRGDNGLIEQDSTLQDITATLTYAKTDFDILAAILGGTVTDSGTGSSEVSTFTLDRVDELGYFKIEAIAAKGDLVGGDLHIVLPKCVASGFPFAGMAEEDYAIQSLPLATSPLISTGRWLDIVLNETATAALAAG